MELSDDLLCLFSGEIESRDGSYAIEVPEREVELGELEPGVSYRIAVVPQTRKRTDSDTDTENESARAAPEPNPPVTKGDHRTVEIETIGDQGDGIARVERGYVVIVPDTDPHERVEIEITSVAETVAFAEVVERYEHHE
ncbi:TRAM domain-containing protein [Halalkalicoccus tibetensis]|uniref:TRAM domain-containing protein n=1 Tax=Halalkalicoccus tibetensis TaxID=175632 RepID=A0ABD5VAG1_9EURY